MSTKAGSGVLPPDTNVPLTSTRSSFEGPLFCFMSRGFVDWQEGKKKKGKRGRKRREKRKKKDDQDLGVLIIKFSFARAARCISLHLLLKLILDQPWHGLLRTRRSLPNREETMMRSMHNHPGHLMHFCLNPIRIALHLVW